MILTYQRVSTLEQAEDGTTSLGEQARKCRAIAQLRGAATFDVVEYVDKGVSGSIPLANRPAGERLMADVKKGDVVVASKLDRLFRSAIDALQIAQEFQKRGIELILVDIGTEPVNGNGAAKLFFSMLSVFAEFERERIAERMADGRRGKRAKGGHLGGAAPYGYRVVGEKREARLEPVESEQEIIRQIKNMWFRADNPPVVVERLAKTKGLRDRAGSPFRIVQLKRIANALERIVL